MVYYLANLGLHKASPRWCTLTTKPILKDVDKSTSAVTRLLEEMVELRIAIYATLFLLAAVTLVATANDKPARSPSGLEVELDEDFLRPGYSPVHPRVQEDYEMEVTIEVDEEPMSAPVGVDARSIEIEHGPTDYVRTGRRPREYQARDYMGFPAFAPEDNFMSTVGKYRLDMKELTGKWMTWEEATDAVRGIYATEAESCFSAPPTYVPVVQSYSPRTTPKPSRRGSQSSARTTSEPAPAAPLTEADSAVETPDDSLESVPESEPEIAVMPSSPSSQPQTDYHELRGEERESNMETLQILGVILGCAVVGTLIWIGAVTTTSARETTRRNTLDEGRGAGASPALATTADGNRAFNVLDIGHLVEDVSLTDVRISGRGASGESIAVSARRQPQGGGDPTLAAMQAMSQALQGPPPSTGRDTGVNISVSPVFNVGAPVATAAPAPAPTTTVRPTASSPSPAPRPEPVRVKAVPSPTSSPVPPRQKESTGERNGRIRRQAIADLAEVIGEPSEGLTSYKAAENADRSDEWRAIAPFVEGYVAYLHNREDDEEYSSSRYPLPLDEAKERIRKALKTHANRRTAKTSTLSPAPPTPAPAPEPAPTPESPVDALMAIGGEPASSSVEVAEPAVALEEPPTAPTTEPAPEPEATDDKEGED